MFKGGRIDHFALLAPSEEAFRDCVDGQRTRFGEAAQGRASKVPLRFTARLYAPPWISRSSVETAWSLERANAAKPVTIGPS